MQIVLAERTEHSVELLCELMSVTSSSYYRWVQTDHQGIRSIEDQQLKEKIKPVFFALMKLMHEEHPKEFKRMGAEVGETVDEVLAKINALKTA